MTAVAVYLLIVGLLGLLVMVRTLMWLRRSTSRRTERLQRRRRLYAVRTKSPVEEHNKLAKERGLDSIRAQASVLRKVLVPTILLVTLMLMSLPFLGGVPAATVSVVTAAAAVTVGIAARPGLENAISGLVMSFSRVVNIGDTVEINGRYGTIEDITGTHVTLKTWDWRRYVITNTEMLRTTVINYTLNDSYVWAHVDFWVSYDASVDEVRELAREAPRSSRHWSQHEEPRVWVMELGPQGWRGRVAAWADGPADAWLLMDHTRAEILRTFRERGIACHSAHVRLDRGPVPLGPEPDRSGPPPSFVEDGRAGPGPGGGPSGPS
jgi:small-conductance mechanosensitive channel